MKKPHRYFIHLFFAITLSSLFACSDSGQQESEKAKPKDKPVALPDSPISKDNCLGWQRSLTQGSSDKLLEVENCLHALAVSNRAEAMRQAKVLQGWLIKTPHAPTLPVLINTLARFESDARLKQYLTDLGVLNGKGAFDEPDRQASLTPDSFFTRHGRVVWFDAETGMFPNQHDYLLSQIAQLSPDLKAATFTEVAPKDDQDDKALYQLGASLNNKRYQQAAQNYGDWYDVEAVLTLLNSMAQDVQSPDRFITLPTNDQTAIVMVIEQTALQTLITDRLIILDDSSRAMLLGKEFEEQMRKSWGGEVR